MSYPDHTILEGDLSNMSTPYFDDLENIHISDLKDDSGSTFRLPQELSFPFIEMSSSLPDQTESNLVISLNEQATFLSNAHQIQTISCVACSQSFLSKQNFDEHCQTHSKRLLFSCPYPHCDKVYKSKENMTLHYKNIHLNDKPYKCRFCASRFSHRNGKTYHERRFHTKILPYICDLNSCGLTFASKSSLNYHKNNQHNINGTLKIIRKKILKDVPNAANSKTN